MYTQKLNALKSTKVRLSNHCQPCRPAVYCYFRKELWLIPIWTSIPWMNQLLRTLVIYSWNLPALQAVKRDYFTRWFLVIMIYSYQPVNLLSLSTVPNLYLVITYLRPFNNPISLLFYRSRYDCNILSIVGSWLNC